MRRLERVDGLRAELRTLERGRLAHQLRARSAAPRAARPRAARATPSDADLARDRDAEAALLAEYDVAEAELRDLRGTLRRDSLRLETADGADHR
jgi:hypothetical protein